MKIHLNQIPSGQTLHVEGEEKGDILDIKDELVRPMRPVRYSLDVGLSDGGLFATGSLEADMEMECVRCLEKFEYTARVPDFATQVELTGAESIDLTEEIREDILLALPPHPHCDWDGGKACAGVRTTTGQTAKTGAEKTGAGTGAQESAPDAEPEGRNPWATLDALTKPKKS